MIGEPDAGNPHVRFDEGRQETCARAARLSPTLQSPQEVSLLSQSTRFVRSALAQIPLFRRTHVSALNFCKSLFRCAGVAIIIQPRWASCITALTRSSTKELPARCAVLDKPPVW
jgi:hypothetical protein